MAHDIDSVGMGGSLTAQHIPHRTPSSTRTLKTPFGRFGFTRDRGDGGMFGRERLISHVSAVHRAADGRVKDIYDLGSGLVTNTGVELMANDFTWLAKATPFCTLQLMNQHLLGTGATAAALTDAYVQTPIAAASLTGSTNGYMAGTQTYQIPTTAVPHPIYQTVATFTANASLAVTEWGLCMAAVLPVNRTSAGSAPTNNTFTDTGATFVTAGNGLAGYTLEAVASTPINTPTTTAMGIVLSNTATVITIQGPSASTAWTTLAAATGANPAATITYSVFPSMFDRKTFSAINLVSLDTLSVTYQLQITSGG